MSCLHAAQVAKAARHSASATSGAFCSATLENLLAAKAPEVAEAECRAAFATWAACKHDICCDDGWPYCGRDLSACHPLAAEMDAICLAISYAPEYAHEYCGT